MLSPTHLWYAATLYKRGTKVTGSATERRKERSGWPAPLRGQLGGDRDRLAESADSVVLVVGELQTELVRARRQLDPGGHARLRFPEMNPRGSPFDDVGAGCEAILIHTNMVVTHAWARF